MSAMADLSTAIADFAAGRDLDAGQADLLRRKVIGTAKQTSGLSAAEFDYSLGGGSTASFGPGRALDALADAAYEVANADLSTVTQGAGARELDRRRERGARLHDWMWPYIETMIAAAKDKQYTGWSTQSPGPIRYALFA